MTKKTNDNIVYNRRASFDYQLSDHLTVGIALTGKEVRAVRDGRISLKGAFVTIRRGELWLNNASFSIKGDKNEDVVTTDAKKLLATKKQIENFAKKKLAGFSIVPVRLFRNGRYIKVEIALGKGKKQYDKRQTIKQRDFDRKIKRNFKGF